MARGSAALRRLWPAAVLLALLALAAGCPDSGPVRIGFCGPLTGRWADLGVQGRNGATLAVEDLNARGGVAGRRVELLVADEADTANATRAAVRELDAWGAAVLVGFMTSSAALAGLPEAAAAGLAVVSPTTATTQLTGKVDNFFRVIPDVAAYARFQADGLARRSPASRVLVVQDAGNPAFAEPYAQAFAERLAQHGGKVADIILLAPGQMPDGQVLAGRAAAGNATAVLALVSARVLAQLVLELRHAAPGFPVYAAMWGFNTEFLEMAGENAEGVSSCLIYPFNSSSPAMAAFASRYRERFGYDPASAALLAYEAMSAAAQALERNRARRAGLAQALARLEHVPGVCGDISLDPYGDVLRPIYWAEVRGGGIRVQVDGRD